MSETSEMWGWYVQGEPGHIDFDTQEAAIDDALEYYGDEDHTIIVGRCLLLTAEACLPTLDNIIEQMEEAAGEDFGTEERVFDYEPKEAEKGLNEALCAWAQKYLKTERWYRIENELEISLAEARRRKAAKEGE